MRKRSAIALTAVLIATALASPVVAASQNTVRASTNLRIYDAPGTRYGVIGVLPADQPVRLKDCTYRQRWCLILDSAGRETGWVRGSYLVGSAAKLEVTRDTDFMRHFLNPIPFSK
ncbi:SH3 domain-containing protein [Devosia sp.]|uniref:SH3 domain-containing protein n=1 Tax=Devosia sp. TaxID=1871048 RepID=UPI003A91BCED